jgi:SulP family sulfate permease
MAATPAAAAAKGARRLHVLEGVLPIDGPRIPADVIAGLTLAALAIPEVMGYTKIAGMPVITGLYTILIPIAVFALLGRRRSCSPDSLRSRPRTPHHGSHSQAGAPC